MTSFTAADIPKFLPFFPPETQRLLAEILILRGDVDAAFEEVGDELTTYARWLDPGIDDPELSDAEADERIKRLVESGGPDPMALERFQADLRQAVADVRSRAPLSRRIAARIARPFVPLAVKWIVRRAAAGRPPFD